ncbi:MAG TPA: PTS sugar transporter subunit IIA [bacterium]|nr:PTS sugar transporter subunit IIA [bacterium]
MKIAEYLDKDSILIGLKGESKKKIIEEIADFLADKKKIGSRWKKDIIKQILKRESLGSTGIGQGIAIPHCRTERVKDIVLFFANSRGVEFNSLDGEPVRIVFFMLTPSGQEEIKVQKSMELLSHITKLLKDHFFREALSRAATSREVMEVIEKEENR